MTILALIASLASSQAWGAPPLRPADYGVPAPIPGDGPFWRVHRFDLERCADDRSELKGCSSSVADCEAKRLEDVTTPPEGLAVSWWQAVLATGITIVLALVAERGIQEIL